MNRSVLMFSAGIAVMALSGSVWSAPPKGLDPARIESAKTAADHEAIAKAYEAEAARFEKTAEMHAGLAKAYGAPGGKPPQAAQAKHCDSVASSLKAAAQEDRALAEEHRKMAHETAH